MAQEVSTINPTKEAVETFLYEEAALLDDWRLDEWFALFVEGATYYVPSAGGGIEDDPGTHLFYIADDYIRLRERIERLKKNEAYAEYPRSILMHMISNVCIKERKGREVVVACNFVAYRTKNRVVDTYFGKSLYVLECGAGTFKIKSKRSKLAMDLLYPGKISIIV